MHHPLLLHLKNLLIRNTGEVLQALLQVFANNRDAFDEVILLLQRWQKLEAQTRRGAGKREDLATDLNVINQSVVALINTITEAEAAAYELENAIFKRILVVCKSAEREEYIRQLFPLQYYKGVEYDISEKPRPAASVNQFDLVVFDNTPHGGPEETHELLRYYLDNTEPYLLYFGQNLPLLWQYPDKAYFANSVFSIHARLEEMMAYLKYKQS